MPARSHEVSPEGVAARGGEVGGLVLGMVERRLPELWVKGWE